MAENRYIAGMLRVHAECNDNCLIDDDDANDTYHDDGMEPGTANLPHRCGLWVIGGPEEIRALISDLQGALMKFDPRIVSVSTKRERYNLPSVE